MGASFGLEINDLFHFRRMNYVDNPFWSAMQIKVKSYAFDKPF